MKLRYYNTTIYDTTILLYYHYTTLLCNTILDYTIDYTIIIPCSAGQPSSPSSASPVSGLTTNSHSVWIRRGRGVSGIRAEMNARVS